MGGHCGMCAPMFSLSVESVRVCMCLEQKGAYVDSALDLADILKNDLQNGDIVLFKGSHSVRLDKLLNAFDK